MNNAIDELREVLSLDPENDKVNGSNTLLVAYAVNWIKNHGAEVLKQLSAGEAVAYIGPGHPYGEPVLSFVKFSDSDQPLFTHHEHHKVTALVSEVGRFLGAYHMVNDDEPDFAKLRAAYKSMTDLTRPAAGVSDEMLDAACEAYADMYDVEYIDGGNRDNRRACIKAGLQAALKLSRDEGNG